MRSFFSDGTTLNVSNKASNKLLYNLRKSVTSDGQTKRRIVKLTLTRWSSVDTPRSGPTLAALIHFLFRFASPTQIFIYHAIL